MLKSLLENADGMEVVEGATVRMTLAKAPATAWKPVAATVTVSVGIIAASI